jgi:hypothetical protein
MTGAHSDISDDAPADANVGRTHEPGGEKCDRELSAGKRISISTLTTANIFSLTAAISAGDVE